MQLFPRYLILTFFALTILVDADWPKFRGPSGEGIWECPNLPLKLDQTKKIWKKKLEEVTVESPSAEIRSLRWIGHPKKIKNEFYVTTLKTANLFGPMNTMQTIQG